MTRHRTWASVYGTAIVLLAVACGGGADRSAAGVAPTPAAPSADTAPTDDPVPTDDPELSPTEASLAALAAMDPDRLAQLPDPGPREGLNSVDPERLVIPAIGVDADIGRAGIDADGEMEVPEEFSDTSWFTPSVKPGRVGPSVITGHVDSRRGPAVFFDLKELAVGDEIEVHGADDEVVVFAVTRVEQHAKDDYPRDAVHGATGGPELRLITCGGIFDRSVGHYDDNIIVFAERL